MFGDSKRIAATPQAAALRRIAVRRNRLPRTKIGPALRRGEIVLITLKNGQILG